MTRKAPGTTNPYRAFEIHSGRTVTTRYSSSALQRDEMKVPAPDTVAWRGARFVAVPVLIPRDER